MKLSVSTHWNAHRHNNGYSMVQEILELGIQNIELGYNTHQHMINGVKEGIQKDGVKVTSLHNFCPVPMGSQGHPETFLLGSLNKRERQAAVYHITKTIELASELNAKAIVVHAARVKTPFVSTYDLIRLIEFDKKQTKIFEKTKARLITRREKRVEKYMNVLLPALETLVPILEKHNVTMGLEVLPTWDAIPSEHEIPQIIEHCKSDYIKGWYDIGHVQIRENLGLVNQEKILPKLSPHIAGFHIHDVIYPGQDHQIPGTGKVDFQIFKPYLEDKILVLEPATHFSDDQLKLGIDHIKQQWNIE